MPNRSNLAIPLDEYSIVSIRSANFTIILGMMRDIPQYITDEDIDEMHCIQKAIAQIAVGNERYFYSYRVLDQLGRGEFSVQDRVKNTQTLYTHVLASAPRVSA